VTGRKNDVSDGGGKSRRKGKKLLLKSTTGRIAPKKEKRHYLPEQILKRVKKMSVVDQGKSGGRWKTPRYDRSQRLKGWDHHWAEER